MVKYNNTNERETFHYQDDCSGWGFHITVVDWQPNNRELSDLTAEQREAYQTGDLSPVIVYADAEAEDVIGLGQACSNVIWMEGLTLRGHRVLGGKEMAAVYEVAINQSLETLARLLTNKGFNFDPLLRLR